MITVTGMDGGAVDQNSIIAEGPRFIRQLIRLTPSGLYVAGGDTLDISNAGGTPAAPNAIPPAQSRGLIQANVSPLATSNTALSAVNGNYVIRIPSAIVPLTIAFLTALKLKIYLANGSEYPAGAYGTDVLADILQAELIWAR